MEGKTKLKPVETTTKQKTFTENEVREILQNNMNEFVGSYKAIIERISMLMVIANSDSKFYSDDFKTFAGKEVETFFRVQAEEELDKENANE